MGAYKKDRIRCKNSEAYLKIFMSLYDFPKQK